MRYGPTCAVSGCDEGDFSELFLAHACILRGSTVDLDAIRSLSVKCCGHGDPLFALFCDRMISERRLIESLKALAGVAAAFPPRISTRCAASINMTRALFRTPDWKRREALPVPSLA